MWDQSRCISSAVCAGAGGACRDLAKSLRPSKQDGVVSYSPSDLVDECSIHELVEQLGLCMMQPLRVTGNHISYAGDATRYGSQQTHPHTTSPGGGVYVAWRVNRVYFITVGLGRRTERKTYALYADQLPLTSISHIFNTLLFRPLSHPYHSCVSASLFAGV